MKFESNNKRLAEGVISRGLSLAESRRWKDFTVSIKEGYKEKYKTSIPENIVSTTAILLENTYDYVKRMDETTRVVNMGSFVDYGFDVISATVPNLVAHEVVSVQPMNAQHAAIFYLQYLAGNSKGGLAAGTALNSPFTGVADNVNFSNEVVSGEVVGTGDATEVEFTTSLAYTPIKPGTVVITAGSIIAADDGEGGFTGTGIVVADSEIDYNEGTVTIKLSTAPAAAASIIADYRYDMNLTTVGYSQVDLDLQSVGIEAHPRKLRSRWLLDAAFELQKMKGIDAEAELVKAMSSEIKYETDGEILREIYKLAGNTGFTWSCQNPTSSLSYMEYKRTLIDVFVEASNKIFTQTKRVGANFIVAGVNVCNIIETLPEFVADSIGTKQINGPHYIGMLAGKWKVYKNPFYNENQFVLGYKGNSWLDAGFVYAPYMPLYTTPTQVMDDFVFRKGLATSYGQVMLNNKLYAKGSITDFSATRMVPAAVEEA